MVLDSELSNSNSDRTAHLTRFFLWTQPVIGKQHALYMRSAFVLPIIVYLLCDQLLTIEVHVSSSLVDPTGPVIFGHLSAVSSHKKVSDSRHGSQQCT